MVKSETQSEFDFNKMYDDTKYEIKKRNKQREIDKTRDENKKRQEEEAAKRKEEEEKKKNKPKPMTRSTKIKFTIIFSLVTIACIPISIYFSSSLLNKLKKAFGPRADLKLKLPSEDLSIPYTEVTRDQHIKKENQKEQTFSASVTHSRQKGGVRKRRQKGGSRKYQIGGRPDDETGSSSSPPPAVKSITDTGGTGLPYSLAKNDNPLIQGFGNFFITYFSSVRWAGVKFATILNDAFFKNFEISKGSGSFSVDKFWDFLTITHILPFLVLLTIPLTLLSSTISLIWASINNQFILMPFFLICSCLSVFVGGNWPSFLCLFYKDVYIASSNYTSTFDTFKIYLKRYKFWWLLLLFLSWGIIIWGFMGGGFSSSYQKITGEPDFIPWLVGGFGLEIIALIIGVIGFGDMFSSDV
jgi:hypothetical protein